MRRSSLVLALAVLVAGCSGGSAPVATAPTETAPPANVAWERAQPLEVVLDDYSFTPSQLVLQANQPYVLRLRNASGSGHTFTAPEFFRTAALGPGGASAQLHSGSVSVAAGETATIDVLPLRPGTYPLACDRPLHSLFGMTGTIVVR